MKRVGRIVGLAAMALLALALLAVLLGALIPRNAGWVESKGTITIGIEATLAHTEIVVPVDAAGHDWRALLPAEAFPAGAQPAYIGISWGDRDFFLATPEWSDLDLRLALRALFASTESLVHIYRLSGPRGRPVRLRQAEYDRLVAHLLDEIGDGPPIAGYGPDDIFLPGTSRYSLLRTCNRWVADTLAAAGVKVGWWTPLAQSFIWRFKTVDGEIV